MRIQHRQILDSGQLQERFESRLNRPSASHVYYWIWAIVNGKLVVIGCKVTEQEAFEFGYSKLADYDFKVEELPTRDMDTAVRMIKGKVLNQTGDIERAIKRARRKA